MTDKTIVSARPVGSDCFILIYTRKSPYKLEHFLNMFNPDDYWIYKSTNKQRLVSKEDLIEFKYSGYIFFKKDLYDKEHIDDWIDWAKYLKKSRVGGIQYLGKPLPLFKPFEKIEIRK